MANINRGKQFEKVIYEAFRKVPNISIDRLPDQQSGYVGSKNICDFIVYKYPYQYYIECKTTYGNTFPLSRLTQANDLFNKHQINGVEAGVIIWWVDKDITKFIPISYIEYLKICNKKSIRYDDENIDIIEIQGKKKRVFFDYCMSKFILDLAQLMMRCNNE